MTCPQSKTRRSADICRAKNPERKHQPPAFAYNARDVSLPLFDFGVDREQKSVAVITAVFLRSVFIFIDNGIIRVIFFAAEERKRIAFSYRTRVRIIALTVSDKSVDHYSDCHQKT